MAILLHYTGFPRVSISISLKDTNKSFLKKRKKRKQTTKTIDKKKNIFIYMHFRGKKKKKIAKLCFFGDTVMHNKKQKTKNKKQKY